MIFESNLNQSVLDVTTFLKVQNILLQIFLNWQTFITFLDNLENAVSKCKFAKLCTLHTLIILVSQLEQTFLNLSTPYGKDKVLLFKNLENYYQLVGLQVNFVKDKISFAIHLPIFLKHIFEIFHLYPIPLNHTIFMCPTIDELYLC